MNSESSPRHRLRVGIIGIGRIGQAYAKRLRQTDGVDLTAVCDVDEAAVRAYARSPEVRSYLSIDQMLAQETQAPNDLDAVFICTPPHSREHVLPQLISRGIPFLAHGPVAHTVEDAVHIARLLNDTNLVHAVGAPRRYHELVDQIKTLTEGRRINLIRSVCTNDTATNEANSDWHWLVVKELSGGPVLQQVTDIIDASTSIAGDVATVHAFGGNVICQKTDFLTVEDTVIVNINYKSGVMHQHAHSWASVRQANKMEIFGHDVYLHVNFHTGTLNGTVGTTEVKIVAKKCDMQAQIASFLEAVRENDQTFVRYDYKNAMHTLAVLQAANESVDLGGVITISPR